MDGVAIHLDGEAWQREQMWAENHEFCFRRVKFEMLLRLTSEGVEQAVGYMRLQLMREVRDSINIWRLFISHGTEIDHLRRQTREKEAEGQTSL